MINGVSDVGPYLFVFGNDDLIFSQDGLQNGVVFAELGDDFRHTLDEIFLGDLAFLFRLDLRGEFFPSLQGKRLGAFHYSFQFSPRVIFSHLCKFIQVDRVIQKSILFHEFCMDLKHLNSAAFIGDVDLDMNLQSSWSEHCLIDQIFSVGDADDKDVVEGVDAVDAGEQLVDDEIVDSVACLRSSFLADGVNLVEDDTVQLTFRAFLLLLLSGVLEKLSYLFFAFAYKFIENFRPVDYLRQNF